MVPRITVVLLLLVVASHAARRSLYEITYRFTSCNSTDHDGPEINQCMRSYQRMKSPIVANEGNFFRFEESFYDGSQGFQVPRVDLYNVTIAGAAGGKGVCNHEFGKGGVVNIQVRLTTDYEYLILVGQKGASVCDKNPNHVFCTVYAPPTNVAEALVCNESWYNWTSSLPQNNSFNVHYRHNGGGGGGGASMVWPRRIADKVFTDSPLAIGPGGGGASAILDYSYLADILKGYSLQYPGDSDNTNIYRYHVNAHSQRYLLLWPLGARGTRPQSTGGIVITSGSGGGWTPHITLPLVDIDGKLLSQKTDFAEGGFDCESRLFSQQDRYIFRDVFGGYGGGGGGCGSGGAGGGYTGGHVFTNGRNIPGGGGDVGFFPDHPDFRYNGNTFHFNSGDGYVEIVSSNCTCTGWCVVYSEENEFECFCPIETTLAGDGSSCYKESNVTVNVRGSRRFAIAGQSYFVRELEFSNTSVSILSLDVQLSVETYQGNQVPDDDVVCVVLFMMENSQFVLTSDPVRVGFGVASYLAHLERDGEEVVQRVSNYSSILDSPIMVTSAILLTNGICSLIGPFQTNISIEETAKSSNRNFSIPLVTLESVVQILQVQAMDSPSLSTTSNPQTGLVIGVMVAIVVVLLAMIGIILLVVVFKANQTKRINNYETSTAGVELIGVNPDSVVSAPYESPEFKNVNYEAVKDSFGVETDVVTGNQYATISIPGKTNTASINPYSVLAMESGTYETPITMSGHHQFTPRYGIIAPAVDFTHYNRERTKSDAAYWSYPRAGLVYIRELGEGQFGKVLLMKAQDIAGYKGKIPVAVKTLTSRDPEVIRKFMEEADLMKKFSHPNIVSLLGIIGAQSDSDIDEDSSPLMILEYMPYGDLQTFLISHKINEIGQTPIGERHFLNFAIGIAKALDFLATNMYVHRDIAARNCLVGPKLHIKIADFGLSRGVNDKNYYKVAGKAVLPVRWMAPECLLFGVFSTASDVWSYGVLLWEIASYGDTPLDDWEVQDIVDAAQKQSLEHTRPDRCSDCFYDLMCLCHKHEPDQRPSFSYIKSVIMDNADLNTEVLPTSASQNEDAMQSND